jgi:hypothetical protein
VPWIHHRDICESVIARVFLLGETEKSSTVDKRLLRSRIANAKANMSRTATQTRPQGPQGPPLQLASPRLQLSDRDIILFTSARAVLLLISVFYLTQARFRRESDLSSRNFCAFTPRLQLALLCTRAESVKTMSGTRSQRRNQRRFSVYVFRETVCPLSLFLSTQAVSPNKWDVVVRQTFRYTQYEAPDVAAMYDTRVPIRRGFARKEIARAKEPQLR